MSNYPNNGQRRTVDVIIPLFNEQETLPVLWQRLRNVAARCPRWQWRFIFVNDGSRDGSRELLDAMAEQYPHCTVIHFSRNFGHQMAVTAGLDQSTGDVACIIDADLQDPPEVMLEMIEAIEDGYNVAYGQRTQRVGESAFKLLTAKWFYRLLSLMTSVEIPVDTGDFRAMDRKVVHAIRSMRERHRFIRGMVAWVGFRSKAILYARDARHSGVTKYPFRKMLRFAMDALYSFSDVPLRVAGYAGAIAASFGILGISYILVQALVFSNYLPGVSAVLFSVLALGGVQLLCIGVLGQYVGRLFDQSKSRPLYLVADIRNPTSAAEESSLAMLSGWGDGQRMVGSKST
jgi:glycosyltransferase involved in cell wall biosynthesis